MTWILIFKYEIVIVIVSILRFAVGNGDDWLVSFMHKRFMLTIDLYIALLMHFFVVVISVFILSMQARTFKAQTIVALIFLISCLFIS